MEQDVHALTAAYALDALDEVEERDYEAHLRRCDRCQVELAGFNEAATMLAYAIDAPPPPPALRERILSEVRQERSNVVELRPRRRLTYLTSAIAAAAVVLAVGIGIWASSLSSRLDDERSFLREARSVTLTGAPGRLLVTDSGEGALVVDLQPAPEGKTYEAWVIVPGSDPAPAALFQGDDPRDFVKLDEPVPPGATVALTVEDEGGAPAPTQQPFVTAQA